MAYTYKALVKEIDDFVKALINEYGYDNVKKAGLGGVVKAFYIGVELEKNVDADEVFNALGIYGKEVNYWESLWYKKNSWLNKEVR